MPQLNIAVQLASLRLPIKKALHAARQMGASAVEIDARGEVRPRDLSTTGLRELRKLLEDFNLKVSAVGFQTRRGYNVADGLEARVQATKEALEFAWQLRAAVVVNHVGHIPAETTAPEWQLLVEVLDDLGRFGQRAGAVLAARTGSESPADLARLLAVLPQGSIGVDLDPGNLIVNGFSPQEAVDQLAPAILHVRATDAVRDLARGRGSEVPLGRGSADFPTLVASLQARGYRGWFTIERVGSPDPMFEIGQAVKYLQSL